MPAAHTRVAWLVESSPQPVAGHTAPADVFLGGSDIDVIVNAAAGADVEALLLSGGIVPADVAMFRTAAGDLVLTLGGGEIVVKQFFAMPGGGINQVAFDSDGDFAAPWLWPAADHALPALPSDWHIEAYAAAPF